MMGAPYLPGFGRCGNPRLSIVRFSTINGSRRRLLFTPCAVKGRGPWNPTSAKTGQIWGTRHSLPAEISPLATIGFLEVCEKSGLGPSNQHADRSLRASLAAKYFFQRNRSQLACAIMNIARGNGFSEVVLCSPSTLAKSVRSDPHQ